MHEGNGSTQLAMLLRGHVVEGAGKLGVPRGTMMTSGRHNAIGCVSESGYCDGHAQIMPGDCIRKGDAGGRDPC